LIVNKNKQSKKNKNMKTGMIVVLVTLGILVLGGVMLASSVFGLCNQEYSLHNTIDAKQRDNQSEYDAMWKTISQVAQVTDAQKKALVEIFTSYAQARTGENKGGSLANWIKESVPNVDTSTFNNLQNILTAKRDGFVQRQKELLDLQREHNGLFRPLPSLDGLILNLFSRKTIDVNIVTSTRTEKAFQSGKDNDVNVFGK
jgi:hypothetical protein